jgi:hypothetical protein
MARRNRVTRLVDRFAIDKRDTGVEKRPFVQNNGGTFTFSTGTEGIRFSLSDSDLLDLMTNRKPWRRIILEENPPQEEKESPPRRKKTLAKANKSV